MTRLFEGIGLMNTAISRSLPIAAALFAVVAGRLVAQSANEPRRIFSTHDFTSTTENSFDEAWVDAKAGHTGASRKVYVVGTVDVETTSGAPTFSNSSIAQPLG